MQIALKLVPLLLIATAPGFRSSAGAASSPDVRILRDNYGVPHIYASELGALFFGYGYAVAEDRLFELEMMRRSVWGTVAEVLGVEYLDFDRRTRKLGYSRADIRARIGRLGPTYQTMLGAYADGINHFVEVAGQGKSPNLPVEFDRVGFRPAQWTAEDVAQLFAGTMASRYSDGSREMETAALLDGLIQKFGNERGHLIFDDILPPTEDPQPVTTIPAPGPKTDQASAPRLLFRPSPTSVAPSGIAEVWSRTSSEELAYLGTLDRLGLASKIGSNAWLIGAKRTGNKTAILMGGPQMGFTTPGYLHEIGLHGAGFDVVGSTPAGYLPILFGHNANISWSSTAGSSDLVDIFTEVIDPRDPTRYKFKGEWRSMQARQETFKAKGSPDVVDTFYRTVHGPVMAVDLKNHIAYSRARAWEELELQSMAGWIDKTQAQTFPEFLAASHKMALTINWYYADRKGNIGYVHNGRYPLRNPATDLRLPTSGTGEREWQGFLPAAQNPHVYNPDQGFIANWNNQPAKGWYFAGSQWSHVDRAKSLIDFLAAKPIVTVDDAKALNRYASFADHSLQFFRSTLLDAVRAAATDDVELQRAVEVLASWDGLHENNNGGESYDSPGVPLFQAWLREILAATFTEAKVGPAASSLQYQPGDTPLGVKVLFRVLAGKARGNYLDGLSPDEAIVRSFRKAVASLRKQFGPDPDQWRAPVRKLVFRNQNFLKVPQSFQDESTLPEMNRGTENHLVVLSEAGVKGVNVVPPGESGNLQSNQQEKDRPSPHTSDQLKLFGDFNYKPMNFYPADVMRAAESEERLSYRP